MKPSENADRGTILWYRFLDDFEASGAAWLIVYDEPDRPIVLRVAQEDHASVELDLTFMRAENLSDALPEAIALSAASIERERKATQAGRAPSVARGARHVPIRRTRRAQAGPTNVRYDTTP